MALADLFVDEAAEPTPATTPKKSKTTIGDAVAGSEAELQLAQAMMEKVEAELTTAIRASFHGKENDSAIDQASTAREAAAKALKLAERKLEAARADARSMAIKAEKEKAFADWSKAIALADARAKALKSFSKTISAFAQDWAEVKRLNDELYGALPAKLDLDGAKMRVHAIADLAAKEMARLGVEWADNTPPSILVSFRPFDEIMADTPAVIRGWRDQLTAWTDNDTEH